jgi:hypothetical protein
MRADEADLAMEMTLEGITNVPSEEARSRTTARSWFFVQGQKPRGLVQELGFCHSPRH